MDTAASVLIDRLAALEAENAALRSQLQSCEQSYAILQAEVIELRQQGQIYSNTEVLAHGSTRAIHVISSGEVLKQSLDLLSTDPDLDKIVGHVLAAIAHQFQSPLTEYWSQDEHTAYVERIYWKGQILDRAAIRHVFPCHVGLEGFTVPLAMIDGLPLSQRKNPIFYDDHGTNPFTKELSWVTRVLLPQGLPKEINVPLFLGNTTIGALTIHLPYDYQSTTEQIELAQALGHQVTLAAEMQRLAEAAKQAAITREQELAAQERAAELAKANESLQRSLNQLANDRNLESFLGHVLQEAVQVLDGAAAQIFLYDAPTDTLAPSLGVDEQGIICPEPGLVGGLPIGQSFPANITASWQRILDHRAPVYFDIEQDAAYFWPGAIDFHCSRGESGSVCTALLLKDQPLGMLGLTFRNRNRFTEAELSFCQALAQQATLAIQLSRLADEAQQAAISHERELAAQERAAELAKANESLQRSLNQLANDRNLESFLGRVLQEAIRVLNGIDAQIFLYDPENHTLFPHLGVNEQGIVFTAPGILDEDLIFSQPIPADTTPAWKMMVSQRRPIHFDLHHPAHWPGAAEWHGHRGSNGSVCVAMLLGDEPLGFLGLTSRGCDQFSEADFAFFQALAQQATLAIQLSHLAEDAKQTAIAREREQAALERAAEFAKANAVLQRNLSWLAREKNLTHFLEQTLLEIATALKADLAHLFILHPDRMIELAARVIDGQLSSTGTPTEPALFAAPFPADITPIFGMMEAEDMLLTLDIMAARPELVDIAWPDNLDWHIREGRKQVGCLVLKAGDRSVGFLGFGFRDYCELSQETRELAMALANQAALAILLSQLVTMKTQAEQARADELARVNQALQRSIDRLANDLNLESFLCSLLQEAIRIIDGLDAQIFLYDPQSHTLRPDLGIDAHGIRLPPYGIIPSDYAFSQPIPADVTPVWSRMLAQGSPIHFPADDPDQWPGAAEFHRSRHCNGAICAPMIRGEEPLGFIGLTAAHRESFTEFELAFCHTITQKATLAIQMTRLAEEAQQAAVVREREKAAQERAADLFIVNEALTKRDRLLSVIAQITQRLLENPNVEQAIQQALQQLGEVAGASRVDLVEQRQDPITGKLYHQIILEWRGSGMASQLNNPSSRVILNADAAFLIAELQAGRPLCLFLHEYPEAIQPQMAELGIQVTGLAPIFIEGEYFGCLCLDNCIESRLWSEQEMDVLITGARAIGAALLRQRLVERLIRSQAEQQRAAELAKANDALKQSLNIIATDADPHQTIAHIVKIVAEQFESPLVEYWTHSPDSQVAHLNLTYWWGKLLTPSEQPEHPGNTDFPCGSCPSYDRNTELTTHFLIEDITAHSYTRYDSDHLGIDLEAWYIQRGVQQVLIIPLRLNEKTIGTLDIWLPVDRQVPPSQIELASTFGQQITLASYLNQLFEEAKQTVLFEERNRIASDIHDTLAQTFTGISLQLEVAKPLILQEPEMVNQILQHISQLAKNGLAEARRSVWALYPPGTEYANLAQMLYDSVEQMSRNTSISIEVNLLGSPCPLPPYIGMNLLRIGQEALTNALKHSQAKIVLIELTYTSDLVSLSIRDDGRGFTPPINLENLNGGFGLVGMYERCDRIGAGLSIISQPGQGTQVLVESSLF